MLFFERGWLVALGVVGFTVSACSATQLGGTEANVATARQKSPPGAEVFDRECAGCHGRRGEGLTAAPAIMGPSALPTYPRDQSSSSAGLNPGAPPQNQDSTRPAGAPSRDAFRNAQDLFDYTSQRMPLPKSRAGSLKPEEYWAVINYMLVAHGTPVPEGGVTADNAKSVPIVAQ
jgi:mono/diheme cytochrome c family protein